MTGMGPCQKNRTPIMVETTSDSSLQQTEHSAPTLLLHHVVVIVTVLSTFFFDPNLNVKIKSNSLKNLRWSFFFSFFWVIQQTVPLSWFFEFSTNKQNEPMENNAGMAFSFFNLIVRSHLLQKKKKHIPRTINFSIIRRISGQA